MIFPRIKPITEKRFKQLQRGANTQEYRDWKDYVKSRDEFKCQYPNCRQEINKKNRLEVHHIKKYANNKHLKTAKFNGITLCSHCHRGIYGREELYELMFFKIVKANENNSR